MAKLKSEIKSAVDEERNHDTRSVVNLVETALKRQKEKETENLVMEKQNEERIEVLMKKERELLVKIAEENEQKEGMAVEYEGLLRDKEEFYLTELSRSEASKKDVLNGKISMSEFTAKGREDGEILDEARTKALKELSQATLAVREKSVEIVILERDLYKTQCDIHNLIIQPTRNLSQVYKQLNFFMDDNLAPFAQNLYSAKSNLQQKTSELSLIEHGISSSGMGKIWHDLTMKEAYRLGLDPVLPEEHIESLFFQLWRIEEEAGIDAVVNVTYHPEDAWPGPPLTVQTKLKDGQILTTEALYPKAKSPGKKREILTTADIPEQANE